MGTLSPAAERWVRGGPTITAPDIACFGTWKLKDYFDLTFTKAAATTTYNPPVLPAASNLKSASGMSELAQVKLMFQQLLGKLSADQNTQADTTRTPVKQPGASTSGQQQQSRHSTTPISAPPIPRSSTGIDGKVKPNDVPKAKLFPDDDDVSIIDEVPVVNYLKRQHSVSSNDSKGLNTTKSFPTIGFREASPSRRSNSSLALSADMRGVSHSKKKQPSRTPPPLPPRSPPSRELGGFGGASLSRQSRSPYRRVSPHNQPQIKKAPDGPSRFGQKRERSPRSSKRGDSPQAAKRSCQGNVIPTGNAYYELLWLGQLNRRPGSETFISENVMIRRRDMLTIAPVLDRKMVFLTLSFRSLFRGRLSSPFQYVTSYHPGREAEGTQNRIRFPPRSQLEHYHLLADDNLFCVKRSNNNWIDCLYDFWDNNEFTAGLRENSATNPIVLFIEGGIDSYDAIFDDIKDDEKMYRQVAKNFVDTLKEIARKLSIIVIYIGGPTVSGDSERHPEYLFKYVRTLINLRNCDRAVRFYDVITPDDATNLFTYTPPRAQVPFATSRSLESASAKYPSEVLLYIKKHVVTPVSHLINFCADKIVNNELCRFDV